MTKTQLANVLLYRAKDMIEGSMLVAMLEESGISAWVAGGQGAIGFGDLPSDCLLVDVRVAEEHHARSIELVKAYFAKPREGEPHEDQPWRCSDCGEAVEGGFSACWNCGVAQGMESSASAGAAVPPIPAIRPIEMNKRWGSWQVKALRSYLALGAFMFVATLLAAMGGLADDGALSLLGGITTLVVLYIAVRWAMGYTDRPQDRDAGA